MSKSLEKTPYENRVAILGSMHEFVQLAQKATSRGCEVMVVDGYPEGPARQYAHKSIVASIFDTEKLAALCCEYKADALITAFSDLLFEEGCKIAHAANLPTACSLNHLPYLRDKRLMKEMFESLQVPFAKSLVAPCDDIVAACEKLTFPCVVKPVDGYGSYDVYKIADVQAARRIEQELAARKQSLGDMLVEHYCDAYEFNMLTWVVGGQVSVISIADREKTSPDNNGLPYVSRIVYPSRYSEDVIEEAQAYAQLIVSFVGIENGPLCMQFFWSPETGMSVCEVAGRVFGYEHELLEYACDLSVEDLLLDSALKPETLGERIAQHDPLSMPRYSCGLYFHVMEGVVGSLAGAKKTFGAPCVKDGLFYYNEGEMVHNGRGGRPYGARAFLVCDTREQLDKESARIFAEFSLKDEQGRELMLPSKLPVYKGEPGLVGKEKELTV